LNSAVYVKPGSHEHKKTRSVFFASV
jgi:hypothetical protein